ncbi:hypothetical protein [Thermosphaera aggregans]|uniref:Uncharacterized protein n=1 Tax=Thermosphaera aggregans (strain DSM 11486 / M11TL) TaxID=633148 RepID=D5U157_THEAM|nr:hypothetical protein [Thermosphaera aggregans]ADG90857.1 hypothetical protein Tagg_0584 [Thermosphaera aggregans DSM 11486]
MPGPSLWLTDLGAVVRPSGRGGGSALISIHIGASTATGITVTPGSAVATVKQGFTQRDLEGPLVTETGAVLAAVAAVVLLLECFFRAKNQ